MPADVGALPLDNTHLSIPALRYHDSLHMKFRNPLMQVVSNP